MREEPLHRRLEATILGGLAEGKFHDEIALEVNYSRVRITQCVTQLRKEYGARTVTQLVVMHDRKTRVSP